MLVVVTSRPPEPSLHAAVVEASRLKANGVHVVVVGVGDMVSHSNLSGIASDAHSVFFDDPHDLGSIVNPVVDSIKAFYCRGNLVG